MDSRMAAFKTLKSVEAGMYLDEALFHASHLEDRDRRFVRLLVATCIRRSGQIDKILLQLMRQKPIGKTQPAIHILRLGIVQLLFTDTGPHAAVNSTVELMRASGFESLTGLANAVMRRMLRESEKLLAKTKVADNLPGWMEKAWKARYGTKRVRAMAELAMQPPPIDITPARDIDALADRLGGKIIDKRTLRLPSGGNPVEFDGYDSGEWWVQDAAAALPATLLGRIDGLDVIDLCAAPGGKTAQLVAAGASVTAIDVDAERVERLHINMRRLGMTPQIVVADALEYDPERQVDAVLIDAPCSATGIMRRRPDILWHRSKSNLKPLVLAQRRMIERASRWLKPGGRIIYSTCSLEHEEGELVVRDCIDGLEGVLVVDPVQPDEAGLFKRGLGKQGTLRIVPDDYIDIGGVDGFYIARLKSAA